MGRNIFVVVNYIQVKVHSYSIWARRFHYFYVNNKWTKHIILYKSMWILVYRKYRCNIYHTIKSNDSTTFKLLNLRHAKIPISMDSNYRMRIQMTCLIMVSYSIIWICLWTHNESIFLIIILLNYNIINNNIKWHKKSKI